MKKMSFSLRFFRKKFFWGSCDFWVSYLLCALETGWLVGSLLDGFWKQCWLDTPCFLLGFKGAPPRFCIVPIYLCDYQYWREKFLLFYCTRPKIPLVPQKTSKINAL
jgi:hypothetical protein